MKSKFPMLIAVSLTLFASGQVVKTETTAASDGKSQATVTVQVNVVAPEAKPAAGPTEERSGVVVVRGPRLTLPASVFCLARSS